jgi:hypothetical protein
MRKQDRDLTLDFFTLAIAVFSLSFIISAFSTMIKSTEFFDRIFNQLFGYSVLSIGISYSIFQIIRFFLSFKFSLPDWSSGALWFSAIISGTFLFSYFAFDSGLFGNFGVFFSWLLLALTPAAVFRLPAEFLINSRQDRKRTPLSIVK